MPEQEEPKQITMTETELAELTTKIRGETAGELEHKWQAEREAAKVETERKQAEEQGKWKELAETAERERDALKGEKAARERTDAIRSAVTAAGKGKDDYSNELLQRYVGDRLVATLPADAKPDAIAKAAKDAVEQYINDNPRQAKRVFGVPNTARFTQDPKNPTRPDAKSDPLGYAMSAYGGPRKANSN